MKVLRLFCLPTLCVYLAFIASPALGAGSIIVQYGGFGSAQFIVNGYPPDAIPTNACGFRLEQPGGWDGGWHFAGSSPGDVYSDLIFGEFSSEDYGTVPDGPDPGNAPDLPEYIQMTGPIHPGCNDNLYFFSTPMVQIIGTMEAPTGTNYFVADFWDDNDIVWLGGAGEVLPYPKPVGEEPPDTPDPCEAWPDFCEPTTPQIEQLATDEFVLFDCGLHAAPGCPPSTDHVGRAIGMLTILNDSAEVAEYFLAKAAHVANADAQRMLQVPLDMFSSLEKRAALVGTELRQIERNTRLVAESNPIKHLMMRASSASGRAVIETRGCQRALHETMMTLGTNEATTQTPLGRASRRCAALAKAASEARNALIRLEAVALPAELQRGMR